MKIRIRYFADLRESTGRREEVVETDAANPADLYLELRNRHGFRLAPEHLRFALNDAFVPASAALADGDTVVFIPPVSGG